MGCAFTSLKAGGFDDFIAVHAVASPRWPGYEAMVCMQLHMSPCMDCAFGSDRWWAVI